MVFFSFGEYWWAYLSFLLLVGVLLAVDLGVLHRKAREVSLKEAAIWTAVWVGLAALFNWAFYCYCLHKFSSIDGGEGRARQLALEFLTGFLVEKSLAVDNIFVFTLIFNYFGIHRVHQHRVLFYGIIGALIFRALFIAIGAQLMAYHFVVVTFGVLLVLTGLKMFFSGSESFNPDRMWLMRRIKQLVPLDLKAEGEDFFVNRSGKWFATRLCLALILIEFTDFLFAVDSVPAIFALTSEPLIVFTSNIFAILGLRSMYFMLSGVLSKFRYIKLGLASVLVFVGLKMAWLNSLFNGKFPVTWSLMIISCLIGASIALSWIIKPKESPRQSDSN